MQIIVSIMSPDPKSSHSKSKHAVHADSCTDEKVEACHIWGGGGSGKATPDVGVFLQLRRGDDGCVEEVSLSVLQGMGWRSSTLTLAVITRRRPRHAKMAAAQPRPTFSRGE